MNANDYNGHTPEDPAPAAELCACCLRDDPAYQLGYREGYEQALMKMTIALLEQANVDATAIRERLEAMAA